MDGSADSSRERATHAGTSTLDPTAAIMFFKLRKASLLGMCTSVRRGLVEYWDVSAVMLTAGGKGRKEASMELSMKGASPCMMYFIKHKVRCAVLEPKDVLTWA